MLERLATWAMGHRVVVLVAMAMVALACLSALPRLSFDFTPQQLFGSESSDANAYREVFAERFGREDNLVFVLVEAPDIFDPAVLSRIREGTVALGALDAVERADSLVTLDLPRAGPDGAITIAPIAAAEQPIDAEIARHLRETLEGEPLFRGRLVNERGTHAPILVRLAMDVQRVEEIEAALHEIERVAATSLPDVRWGLGGIPSIRTKIVEDLKADQLLFIPVIGAIYILVLLLMFRRVAGVALPLIVVGYTLLLTLGLLALTGSPINIINNVLPSLIFVIAASDSIHLLQRDAEEMGLGAPSRTDAIRRTIQHAGLACLLTSATTAIGFLSLYVADTRVLRQFSWQAGFGVAAAWVVSMLLIPTLLMSLRPVRRSMRSATPSAAYRRVGERVLRRPRTVLVVAGIVTAILCGLGAQVRIDSYLFDVFGNTPAVRQVTSTIEREFGGALPIEISLEGSAPHTFADPARYAAARTVQRFAAEQPGVLSTESFVDYHQAARVVLLGDEREREVMPASAEEVLQIHSLLQGAPDERAGVRRFADEELRHARILVRVVDQGGQAQLALAARLEEQLEAAYGGDAAVTFRLTGDAHIASQALHAFVAELFESLVLAFLVILGVMTLAFRSLRIGLLAMVPNLLPLLATFGYMGLRGIPLDVTTVTTFAIGLGLAVDDTIHFVSRFLEEHRSAPAREALLATYAGAGRAIVNTSVLLMLGIGVLQLSSFQPTQIFSTLMLLTIGSAVVADLVVLPALLLLTHGDPREPRHSP